MPSVRNHKMIPGSKKRSLNDATFVGEVDPTEQIEITILLRPRSGVVPHSGTGDLNKMVMQLPEKRRHISHEDFAKQRGADPADVLKVRAFAHEHHLTVVDSSIARRSIKIAGTIGNIMAAFKPTLKRYKIGNRHFRGRTGGIYVPHEISEIVVGVFGIDDRPVTTLARRVFSGIIKNGQGRPARTNPAKRERTVRAKRASTPHHGHSESSTLPTVAEITRRYNFPEGLDGSGQCIALIELNDVNDRGKITGTGFSSKDLQAYFKSIGKPMPKIITIGVNGGANRPRRDLATDGEVMLDIEVAGSVAPGSTIAVYFAPNNARGFIDAVNTALHDRIRKPSVISISWALGDEEEWTRQGRNAFSQILKDAAAMGVTVCCASGDSGSDMRDQQQRDGRPHLYFPVADPYILTCGGTELLGIGSSAREEVWKAGADAATGGGVSVVYDRPAYQSKAKVPRSPKGRYGCGVPDVAGYAAGYRVREVGGLWGPLGGTSAVSPLWAGLIALINQRLERLGKPRAGFINPWLYKMSPTTGEFHDIVQGDNDIDGLGKYKAGKGWDACTGLGTPDGIKLMEALGG